MSVGQGEIGGNSALMAASMIPGPQQPFVAGASMLAPFIEQAANGPQQQGMAGGIRPPNTFIPSAMQVPGAPPVQPAQPQGVPMAGAQPGGGQAPMMQMPSSGQFPNAPGQPPRQSPQNLNPGANPQTLAMLQMLKLMGVA